MTGRWAVSWGVAMLVAAAFLIPAVASASASGAMSAQVRPATTVPPSPSPSLLWPCYDPRTLPPSTPPLTPPTAPGAPTVVQTANIYVTLRWGAASDPDGLACYQVYEDRNGTQAKIATFGPDVTQGTFTVSWPQTGTPSRIATLYVVAVDRWGAESPPSPTVQVTIYNDLPPSPTPSPTPTYLDACHVSYHTYNWFGGMTAYVTISNTGSTPITWWRLTFAFPDSRQRLTNGWEAEWSQSGQMVNAAPLAYNRNIAPGGAVTLGFNGTNGGVDPAPTVFQLNGLICR